MSEAKIQALIKEFKVFRKKTSTCNSIRLDEVAQFVLYKQGYPLKNCENKEQEKK